MAVLRDRRTRAVIPATRGRPQADFRITGDESGTNCSPDGPLAPPGRHATCVAEAGTGLANVCLVHDRLYRGVVGS